MSMFSFVLPFRFVLLDEVLPVVGFHASKCLFGVRWMSFIYIFVLGVWETTIIGTGNLKKTQLVSMGKSFFYDQCDFILHTGDTTW